MPRRTEEVNGPAPYLLSVVIPTRNERASAPLLVPQLYQVLTGIFYEVIFVDDSDDDTPQVIQRLADESGLNVGIIHREGEARRGGLSTAVVRGIRAAGGQYVCIMDADLQHPPELVMALLSRAKESAADIIVASRHVKGGSAAGLSGLSRKMISWAAKRLVKVLFHGRLRSISDPLSGFFLVRRTLLDETSLRPRGFKILLDILIRCPWSKAEEIPLPFAHRAAGASKATLSQGKDFLAHALSLFWEVRFDRLIRRFRRSAYRHKP